MIPREFIQQLLNRVDVVELIDGRVPLRKKSSNNYFACCPFHTEKSASFSVSQNKQFYYCFGCGAHGNAIDFLIQFDRLSFKEAIEALAKQAGIEVPKTISTQSKATPDVDLYELMTKISMDYQSELRTSQAAIQYLKSRGLTGEIVKEFKMGYAPNKFEYLLKKLNNMPNLNKHLFDTGMIIKKEEGHFYDRFRDRIMFPIQDRRGRIVGFGGRVLGQGEPKYLNSPETILFQKGHELYGLYQALQHNRQLEHALIVEGYMDVVALFQHGITYAMATLGTATTPHHLSMLSRYTSKIIFCFDGDEAGRNAAWRALIVTLPIIRDDQEIKFMFLPEGEDPDSLVRKEGKNEFEKRIAAAEPLSQFFFQTIGVQADLSHADGRARFVKLAKDHLDQLPSGIFKQMMFDELAKMTRIDSARLKGTDQTKVISKQRKALKARSPSALRLALTLVVQEPSLANLVTEPLPDLSTKGYALFLEIIHLIKEKSIKTTGMLLEYFRDHIDFRVLAKLAQVEHMIPLNGVQSEFLGAIMRLKTMAKEQIIEHLLAKAAIQILTDAEKQLLNELIHSKK